MEPLEGGPPLFFCGMEPFERGLHYLHYLHQSLASSQISGREHNFTHQQKIGLKLTEHGPTH